MITKSELGGAQSHVLDLLEGFHLSREVHLATGVEGPLTEKARDLGVAVHLLPGLRRSINPLADAGAVRECLALVRRLRPTLLHAHSSKAGIVGRVAGQRSGVPVVFTAHGWGFSPGTPPLRRLLAWLSEKGAAPLAARLICVSENDRRLALRCTVGTRRSLVTVRYGINPTAPLADPARQPPRFVMVARFNEQKDQPALLKALARIKDTLPRAAHVDFIGSGPALEECKALARTLGVEAHVSFLGDRHDVPLLLSQAQGFILSTHYEGLPISIMEAMRAGLPVIATKVSGIPEEVIHGQTGLLVPYGSSQALGAALQALFSAPQRRRQMGQAARQRFLQEFTLERMLAQLELIYNQAAPAPNVRQKRRGPTRK